MERGLIIPLPYVNKKIAIQKSIHFEEKSSIWIKTSLNLLYPTLLQHTLKKISEGQDSYKISLHYRQVTNFYSAFLF